MTYRHDTWKFILLLSIFFWNSLISKNFWFFKCWINIVDNIVLVIFFKNCSIRKKKESFTSNLRSNLSSWLKKFSDRSIFNFLNFKLKILAYNCSEKSILKILSTKINIPKNELKTLPTKSIISSAQFSRMFLLKLISQK